MSTMLHSRNIVLIYVVVTILLHAAIPHAHHGELSGEEHDSTCEQADDILDYLGVVFQHDSNDSLNKYISSNQTSSPKINRAYFLLPDGTNFTLLEGYATGVAAHFKTQAQLSFDDHNPASNRLRAPPILDFYS